MDPEYILISLIIFVILIIAILIFSLSYILNYQSNHFSKLSSYECGFLPFDDSRGEFNIEFYLVGILFVIFDLEIIFFFPLCVSLNMIGFFGATIAIIFLIILTIGFFYEWIKGGLDW